MPAAEDLEEGEEAAEVVSSSSLTGLTISGNGTSPNDPLDVMRQLFGDLGVSSGGAAQGGSSGPVNVPRAAAGPSLLDILTEPPPPSVGTQSLLDVLNGPNPSTLSASPALSLSTTPLVFDSSLFVTD